MRNLNGRLQVIERLMARRRPAQTGTIVGLLAGDTTGWDPDVLARIEKIYGGYEMPVRSEEEEEAFQAYLQELVNNE